MTPAQAIGMLDRQIAKHGQTVIVRRAGNTPVEVTVKAFVRNFKPAELVGDIRQGDASVILSPTGMDSFPFPVQRGDKVVIVGATRNVEWAEHVMLADQLVRINLVVRG